MKLKDPGLVKGHLSWIISTEWMVAMEEGRAHVPVYSRMSPYSLDSSSPHTQEFTLEKGPSFSIQTCPLPKPLKKNQESPQNKQTKANHSSYLLSPFCPSPLLSKISSSTVNSCCLQHYVPFSLFRLINYFTSKGHRG